MSNNQLDDAIAFWERELKSAKRDTILGAIVGIVSLILLAVIDSTTKDIPSMIVWATLSLLGFIGMYVGEFKQKHNSWALSGLYSGQAKQELNNKHN